ncbi:MAG TPA: rRNA maturation RNase YbeY [Longimicrobiales bacterium]|nr:rRNA maturation RNase YbeY [Longimicrobiales bacterium]
MIEIQIDDGARPGHRERLHRAVAATLDHEGVEEGEISLSLMSDAAIQGLNRDHLGHDYPTDVLAFALWSPGEPVLGDVYVGVEQAVRQAREEGVPVEEELVRLAIHGTLHILGHDHPDEAEARPESPMYGLQEELVRVVLAG